ncbi:MAG: EamA family transporter RarD, partial [Caldilineaceae bacterium]|nr:EamA family transporter RarD [Caldilineaceae bacterium]
MNRGVLYVLGAYLAWGCLPIFWKAMGQAAPLEILAHRIVWSLVFLLLVLAALRQWRWLRRVITDRRILLTFGVTSLVLSINWLTYIWAVNTGHVVESSLGYFINPLVNVVLGVAVLHERMRWGQWAAVGLAALGVLYLTISLGALPWIALTLAFSFGIYALVRKTASLNSLEGLTVETLFMIVPAAAYLFYLEWAGQGTFGHVSPTLTGLLMATGVVTAIPLLLFAAGARRIPLSLVGILQYTSPTIQFLLGVFLYREPFSATKLVGFVLIWLALALYSGEGIWHRRQVRALNA